MVNLDEVCEIIAGQSPLSEYYNQNRKGLPFFQGKADFGEIYPSVRYWCDKPTKIALPNDILLSVRAPVGSTNICNEESCIGRGLSAIRAGEKVNYKYLFYFLRSIEKKLAGIARGSTFTSIIQSDIEEIKFPLISFSEQQKIASILEQADTARQKRKQANQLTEQFLQSVFIEMFGDPVRNEKNWEVKRLEDISDEIQIGPFGTQLHEEDYIENGIPLINPKHIVDGKIEIDSEKTITKEKFKTLSNYHLKTGDVIMGRRGEMGRCALITVKEDGWLCGTGSLFIRPSKYLNCQYLIFVISSKSFIKNLENAAQGVTMMNLNSRIIQNLPIACPPLPLQQKFASLVERVEKLREKQRESEKELENLFQSLMQRYFN